MTKIKRRELEVHTVTNKAKHNVQKCVVKLKRLGRGTSTKIDNFPYKKQQDEPVNVLYSSSSEEDIYEEEIIETKVQKFKNCVVRLKRDLLQMAHHVKGGKSVTEKKPTPLPISYPNSDSSTSAQIENVSNNPKAAPKSPDKVTSPEHFMAPPKMLRNLPNKHSRGKKQKSREVRKESNENDDVYEFPSQSSISEKEDPTSDIVQQLIKHGKVSLAKHSKNRGRPKLNKKKAAPKPANRKIKKVINEKPEEIVKKPRNVELPAQTRVDVNSSPLAIHPVERVVEDEPLQSHQRIPVTDKRKLLEVARNFIQQSTPIRKKTAVPMGSPFSPIAMKSPWRPTDNTLLPRVFYFSRNEDDLPSYSSDIIASSQVERSRRSVLNHSDIENVNPNNEALSNNNPRKTLGHRSPLKSINILEVVNLPRKSASNKDPKSFVHPLACNNSTSITKSPRKVHDVTQPSRDFDPEKLSIDNCFGFDDCPENVIEEKSTVVPNKNQLRMRLKHLQSLLPQKSSRKSTEKVKTIFPKQAVQKDIRDVLTSTFHENKNITNASNVHFDSSIDISAIREEEDQGNSNVHLFDDLDEHKPDSTAHLRTYIREKRRRRHSFLLSDEEEEEEEVEVQEVQKKKRTKTNDAKSIKELKKFVKEFNSICEEVNQYQLHIEKE